MLINYAFLRKHSSGYGNDKTIHVRRGKNRLPVCIWPQFDSSANTGHLALFQMSRLGDRFFPNKPE